MLIIEDGSIVAGADSYATVAECDLYHSNRGNTAWAGTDEVKEAVLRKAAQYLDGHYRMRWKGQPTDVINQMLAWPRVGVCLDGNGFVSERYDIGFTGLSCINPDVIPQRIKNAQCELALIALSADLAPNVSAGIKREKVDVLETEYFAGTPAGTTVYTSVNNLLSDLLKPLNSSDLVRG